MPLNGKTFTFRFVGAFQSKRTNAFEDFQAKSSDQCLFFSQTELVYFLFLCGEEVHQGSKTFAAKFVYTLNVMAWYVRNMKKQIEEKRKGNQKVI